MEAEQLIQFAGLIEKLKCNTRHSWTTSGRQESVAEHCFMLALLSYFVRDEFPEADMNRVMLMCLVHDFGEALTGDIPAFLKTGEDEAAEDGAVSRLLAGLPDRERAELTALFAEMKEMKTAEAKICKALDKMEAVLQHNEASIETWLPLEYELQMNYGEKEVAFSPYMTELKERLNRDTEKKIREAGAGASDRRQE